MNKEGFFYREATIMKTAVLAVGLFILSVVLIPLAQANENLAGLSKNISGISGTQDRSTVLALHAVGGGGASTGGSSAVKVQKVTSAVKSYDGKTLVLENGKEYSLSGVKVMNFSAKRKAKALNAVVAEMTFVGSRLTEVVLRLR
jgi:hypothetical protein